MGSPEGRNDLDRAEEWRDSHGKRLVDYPRPSLAVDVAVLTLLPGTPRPVTTRASEPFERGVLAVVVHRRPPDPDAEEGNAAAAGSWALPGTFLHKDERGLADAARRALRDKCDIKKAEPRQLRVFDEPGRDPRGWVVSVAHWAVVPYRDVARVLSERDDVVARPVAAPGALDDLAFDHREIIASAVEQMRAEYAREPDPAGLLAEPFTLLHLRVLHEAVLGETLQKDTFRRRMEPQLTAEGGILTGAVGRPAQLYHRSKRSRPVRT